MSRSGSGADVAIAGVAGGYPEAFPYDPGERYPEYRGGSISPCPNPVYAAVRQALFLLGLDRDRFGSSDWNPLGEIIRPGNRVFLKPNLVTHAYGRAGGRDGDLWSVITHPSVVRALADYAALALGGSGEIVIGDNPSVDADFAALAAATRLPELGPLYRDRFRQPCRVLDLRPARTVLLADYGFRSRLTAQDGDPEGAEILDLGERSFFHGRDARRFRGVFTDRRETIRHHSGGRHQYSISRTILNADVFLSVPKLKSHHKVGATLNIKGLVGICSNKNLLVHWQVGHPGAGGDEVPAAHRRRDAWLRSLRQMALDRLPEAVCRRVGRALGGSAIDRWLTPERRHGFERYRGAWDGNDSCWRMAADLHQAFVADAAGWRQARGRETRFFSLVDGVIGGEGDGPFCPLARPAGVVLAGGLLLAVDLAAARLMDFDIRRIAYLDRLAAIHGVEPDRLAIASDRVDTRRFFAAERRYLDFLPPSGWPRLGLHRLPGEPDEAHHPCRGQGRAPAALDPQHAQAAARSR